MSSNLSISVSVTLRSGDTLDLGLTKGAARHIRKNCRNRSVPHSVMKVHGLTLYHRMKERYFQWQEAVDQNPSSFAGLAYLAGRVVIGDTEVSLPRKAWIDGNCIVGRYADGSESVFGPASEANCAALSHLRVLKDADPAVEVAVNRDVTLSLTKASVAFIAEEKNSRHVPHSVLVVDGEGVYHRFDGEHLSIPAAVRRFPASIAGFARLAGTVTINGEHYRTPRTAAIKNGNIVFDYGDGDSEVFGPATSTNKEAMKRLRLLS